MQQEERRRVGVVVAVPQKTDLHDGSVVHARLEAAGNPSVNAPQQLQATSRATNRSAPAARLEDSSFRCAHGPSAASPGARR